MSSTPLEGASWGWGPVCLSVCVQEPEAGTWERQRAPLQRSLGGPLWVRGGHGTQTGSPKKPFFPKRERRGRGQEDREDWVPEPGGDTPFALSCGTLQQLCDLQMGDREKRKSRF